MVILNVS